MNTEDLTQTLESVIDQERAYPYPLRVEDRRHLFGEWLEANPDAVSAMEAWALDIDAKGEPVSVQRLFERIRWSDIPIVRVGYRDDDGKLRRYRINHNDRALLGRHLQRKFPEIHVSMRRSIFDGGEA